MGRGSWWQRSLDRHFRLLEARYAQAEGQRRRIDEKQQRAFVIVDESVAYVDALERKKIAKNVAWRAKWDARKAKFNAGARKHSQRLQE